MIVDSRSGNNTKRELQYAKPVQRRPTEITLPISNKRVKVVLYIVGVFVVIIITFFTTRHVYKQKEPQIQHLYVTCEMNEYEDFQLQPSFSPSAVPSFLMSAFERCAETEENFVMCTPGNVIRCSVDDGIAGTYCPDLTPCTCPHYQLVSGTVNDVCSESSSCTPLD